MRSDQSDYSSIVIAGSKSGFTPAGQLGFNISVYDFHF